MRRAFLSQESIKYIVRGLDLEYLINGKSTPSFDEYTYWGENPGIMYGKEAVLATYSCECGGDSSE